MTRGHAELGHKMAGNYGTKKIGKVVEVCFKNF